MEFYEKITYFDCMMEKREMNYVLTNYPHFQ